MTNNRQYAVILMKLKSCFFICLTLSTIFFSTHSLFAFDTYYCPKVCKRTPYDVGRWSFSANGGVVPTWFVDEETTLIFPRTTLISLGSPHLTKLGNFDNLFGLPWTAGAEIGYMVCCRWEIFTDFDYISASGKNRTHPDELGGTINEVFHQYRLWDWYLGLRYYLPPIWQNFTPFIGGKAGIIHRNGVATDIIRTDALGLTLTDGTFNLFRNGLEVSGGVQFGINYDVSACFSLTLKAEAIWSGCWNLETRDESNGILLTPIVVPGNIGGVFTVPVTLGLRFAY